MNRRTSIINGFVALLAPFFGRTDAAAKPTKPRQPVLLRPSDWQIECYFEPMIDLFNKNPKELRKFLDQMDRVVGRKKLERTIYLSLRILRPDLMSRRLIDRVARRQLHQ